MRKSEAYGPASAAEAATPGSVRTEEQGAAQGSEAAAGDNHSPLYEKYIEARKRCNAGVKGLSEEKFAASIKQARERIEKTYNVKETEVTVIEKDGQVKLAIRPKGVKVK